MPIDVATGNVTDVRLGHLKNAPSPIDVAAGNVTEGRLVQ
jgi:hypothetical protein